MAGTIYGSVNHFLNNTTGANFGILNLHFVTIYNFLNSHWTRIAANYGAAITGYDGNGFNYFDAPSGQTGNGAWAVFRTNGNKLPPYNVVLKIGNGAGWTDFRYNGNTFSNGVAMGGCLLDNGLDGWAGTTNNNGNDTAASPVWDIGSANHMFTFDSYNSPGGARQVQKDSLLGITLNSNTLGYSTINMWMDDDNFACTELFHTSTGYSFFYLGEYLPYEEDNMAAIGLSDRVASNLVSFFSSGYGEGSSREGAVYSSKYGVSGGIAGYSLHETGSLAAVISNQQSFFPNPEIPAGVSPIIVAMNGNATSSTGNGRLPLGYLNTKFIKQSFNTPHNTVCYDSNQNVYISFKDSNTARNSGIICPWASNIYAGANLARAGIQFEVTL